MEGLDTLRRSPQRDQGVVVSMLELIRRAAWTWQALLVYLLAEFAIFSIASRLMHAFTGHPDPDWLFHLLFYFLPLTVSSWWVLKVLFTPRAGANADR